MSETIDLVLQVKAQADQAKTEIAKIIETLQALRNSTDNAQDVKGFNEQIAKYKELAKAIDEAGDATKKLTLVGTLDGIKKLADGFKKATSELKNFADDAVNSARELMKFEKVIKNYASSADEAKNSLNFLKEYSLSKQPFETKDIYEAGAQLGKFGLDIKETLPLVANLAAKLDNDLPKAAMAVSRALTGTRGGVTLLQREYALTAEKLAAYGAEMTKSGEVEDDSIKTKEAIIKALQDMQGASDQASNSYAASLAQYNNQMNALKVEIGQNLLPLLTTLTQTITGVVKEIDKIPGAKQAFVAISTGILGVVLIGNQLAGTIGTIAVAATTTYSLAAGTTTLNAAVMAAIPGLTAFQASLVATVGIAGAVAAAIYIVSNAWIKYKTDMALAEQEAINDILSKRTDILKRLAAEYGALQNPTSAIKNTLEEINKNGDAFYKSSEGQAKLKDTLEILNVELKLTSDRYKEIQAEVKRTNDEGGISSQLPALAKQLVFLDESKKKLEEFSKKFEMKEATDKLQSNLEKTRKTFDNLWNWKFTVDDKDFNSFISSQEKLASTNKKTYAQLINTLGEYKKKHQLTKEQELILDEKVEVAKKRIAEESIKDVKTNYDEFIASQKLALAKGQINERQYYESLKLYLSQHLNELNNNKTLKTQIEMDYYTGINKLAEESASKQKAIQDKKLQEENERQQQYTEYIRQLNAEEDKAREEQAAKEKEAAEKKKQATIEIDKELETLGKTSTEKEIINLNDKVKAWKEAGVEQEKTSDYLYKSLKKMSDDSFKDFKEKEEQKRDEMKKTLQDIQDLEDQIAGNKKERTDLVFGFDNTSPIMSMADAFSGKPTEKQEKIAELDKKNKELEEDKTKKQSELAKQSEEAKKVTEEFNKAQTAINTALNTTTDAYKNILAASPWKAEEANIKSASSALSELNGKLSDYNSLKGGGGSSPSSAASPLSTPAMTQAVSNGTNTVTDFPMGTYEGMSGGYLREVPNANGENASQVASGHLSNAEYASQVASSYLKNGISSLNSTNNSMSNSTINNSSDSSQKITIENLNVDGRSSTVSSGIATGTRQILSDNGVAKYLTKRS